ncbi:hypothetical protein PENSPDRAFT_666356 [Peniophora sp. CONT]|nr:hypothetical protein PENSPDRAFT_666356 [Peniophora sp. CONT]
MPATRYRLYTHHVRRASLLHDDFTFVQEDYLLSVFSRYACLYNTRSVTQQYEHVRRFSQDICVKFRRRFGVPEGWDLEHLQNVIGWWLANLRYTLAGHIRRQACDGCEPETVGMDDFDPDDYIVKASQSAMLTDRSATSFRSAKRAIGDESLYVGQGGFRKATGSRHVVHVYETRWLLEVDGLLLSLRYQLTLHCAHYECPHGNLR